MARKQRRAFQVTNPFNNKNYRISSDVTPDMKVMNQLIYGNPDGDSPSVKVSKTKLDASKGDNSGYYDDRDRKFYNQMDNIQKALDSYDQSDIPKAKPNNKGKSKGKSGGSNNAGNSDSVNRTNTNFDDGGNSTMNYNNNTINTSPLNSNSMYNTSNSTSSNSYSTYTGRGSGSSGGGSGSGGNGGGGSNYHFGASRKGPNGGGTALSAKKGGGGGSAWYELSEFTTSDIRFNSGIPSGITFDPDPEFENGHSQLYITQGSLLNYFKYDWTEDPESPRTSEKYSNYYTKALSKDIYYAYLHQIEKVRNRELGSRFTLDKFVKYVDSVIQGLQVYYCLESILAFDRDANHYNDGMSYLRGRMSTDVISELSNLRRCLERQVMKPQTVEFIRFMYQNFKFYDGHNTSIIRLSYHDMLADNVGKDHLVDPSMIRAIIDQIQSDFSGAFSYIVGGFPEYKLIGKLPPSTTKALVNVDFNTWWHNHCVSYPKPAADGASIVLVNHSKYAVSDTDEFYFGVYGDSHDGLLHAASSTWLADKEDVESGIWRPLLDISEFRDESVLNAGSLKFYKPKSTSAKMVSSCTDLSSGVNAHMYISVTYDITEDAEGEPLVKPTEIVHMPVGVHRVLAQTVKMMKGCAYDSVLHLLHP